MTEQKKYFRVWRVCNEKYNGFDEVKAESPKNAVSLVCSRDYEDGDTTDYKYEVDRISDLSGDGAVIEYCGEF